MDVRLKFNEGDKIKHKSNDIDVYEFIRYIPSSFAHDIILIKDKNGACHNVIESDYELEEKENKEGMEKQTKFKVGDFGFDSFHASCPERQTKPSNLPINLPSIFTDNPKTRKSIPVYSGFIKYFPRAIAAVANLSYIGNQQHHPDKPLFWDKPKSSDHTDAMMRHLIDDVVGKQRGEEAEDTEENPFVSVREKVAVAWRAMAELEIELERKEKEGK